MATGTPVWQGTKGPFTMNVAACDLAGVSSTTLVFSPYTTTGPEGEAGLKGITSAFLRKRYTRLAVSANEGDTRGR